jgi:CRP-like cAMP-binding protein
MKLTGGISVADDRVDLFIEIRKNHVFRELDDQEVTVLAGLSEVCCMRANETFIREGEKDHCLYIIKSGHIEILKKSSDTDDDHCLAVLGSGNCIGEMSLVEIDSHRSASAKTREDSVVIKIDFDKVIHNPNYKLHHYKLLSGIAKDLSRKLSHTNDITVKAMKSELEVSKARVAMGLFTVNLLFALSIYTLTLRTLAEVIKMSGNYVTIITGIIIFFSLFIFVLIRKSGYPLRTFGLTTANWKLLFSAFQFLYSR